MLHSDTMKKHRKAAALVPCLQVLGWALLLILYRLAYRAMADAVAAAYVSSFHILLTLSMGCLHFFLTAPWRAGVAAFYQAWQRGENASWRVVFRSFRPAAWGKSIALHAAVWMRRLLWYAVVCLPSAYLLAVCDRLQAGGLAELQLQVGYFLLAVAAVLWLVLGVAITEWRLLRYTAAWYLLPNATVRQALRQSRRWTRGRREALARLYVQEVICALSVVLLLPYIYAAARREATRAALVAAWQSETAEPDGDPHVYFAAQCKNC